MTFMHFIPNDHVKVLGGNGQDWGMHDWTIACNAKWALHTADNAETAEEMESQ
jgi:hypothetical protein